MRLERWVRRFGEIPSRAGVAATAIMIAGGCSSPAPTSPGVVDLSPAASGTVVAGSATSRASDAPPAKCVVQGTKLPFTGCDALVLEVMQSVGGASRQVARLSQDADVTLTFGATPLRTDIVAASERLRARGTLDPSHVWLPLVRPIAAADGHVKVFGGAPVRVRAVRSEGIDVDVWMGFGSVDTIPGVATCKDLAFAPVELQRIEPATAGKPNAVVYQPKGGLSLFDAPAGKELMRIEPRDPTPGNAWPPRSRPGIPRAANLEVLDQKNGFYRIAFGGTFVAVDAWVREGEIEQGMAQGFGGGYGCGGGSGSFKGKPAKVTRDTRLSLGESASSAAPVDVEVLKGAAVTRGVEEGGIVMIQLPKDPIQPPTGEYYWIDPGALE